MCEHRSHILDQHLASLARADARRLTPRHCEMIHARVMRAVVAAQVRKTRSGAARRTFGGRWMDVLAAAAVLMIVAAPTAIHSSRSPSHSRHASRSAGLAGAAAQTHELPVYAAANEVDAHVRQVVETAMVEQQYVGLDHDFRSATRYLVDQVPLRSVWDTRFGEAQR